MRIVLEDRRQSPRYPVLIRTVVSSLIERFDAICTSVSPTGGFLTTRNPPPVGTQVAVEIRSGGVDSPIVFLHGRVVRTVLVGSPTPVGFGVVWEVGRCDRGWAPLIRVLRQILHVDHVDESGQATERAAEYVFKGESAEHYDGEFNPTTARSQILTPDHRASSVRQMRGVWSPPVHRAAHPKEAGVSETGRQPAQNPMELDAAVRTTGEFRTAPPPESVAPGLGPRLRPDLASSATTVPPASAPRAEQARASAVWGASMTPSAPLVGDAGNRFSTARRSGAVTAEAIADRSQVFEGFTDAPSMSVGRLNDSVSALPQDASQSWPVYALAPGERRAVSQSEQALADRSDAGARPVAPGARPSADVPPARNEAPGGRQVSAPVVADAVFRVAPRVPASQPSTVLAAQPVSQPFGSTADLTAREAAPPRAPVTPAAAAQRRQPDASRMLYAPNVPVTFLRRNRFVPAELIGLAEQLAAVVTKEDPPDLDELLVIHLPVRHEGVWRTVHLSGKLLQVATETAEGKRFVIHIERTEEGRHKGAFRAFLQGLAQP